MPVSSFWLRSDSGEPRSECKICHSKRSATNWQKKNQPAGTPITRRRENRELLPEGKRRCSLCRVIKSLDEFWNARRGTWAQAQCKVCSNTSRKKNNSNSPEQAILNSAKWRASQRKQKFSITINDIVIPKKCPILGIRLVRGKGKSGPRDNSPSIDRINNKLGYVPGNVIIISFRANRLKSDSTPFELKRIADFYESLSK